MSFAIQALAAEHRSLRRAALARAACIPVPLDIDREVARLKLASLGVGIDALTDEAAPLPHVLATRPSRRRQPLAVEPWFAVETSRCRGRAARRSSDRSEVDRRVDEPGGSRPMPARATASSGG